MRCLSALAIAAILTAGDAPPVTPPAPKPAPAPAPAPAGQPAAKAYLGVAIDPAATAFDAKGLSVLRVEPGSPAAVMGLQAGDRIQSIDGTAMKSQDDLAKVIAGKKPGDQVKLEILRAQGKDGLPQVIQVAGALQEAPRSRSANLTSQLSELQARIAELSSKSKEPTLAEVLQKLQDIEQQLPRAAEQFKRVYPDGEFRIVISVEITSDKKAKAPLDIDVGAKPAEAEKKAAPEEPKKAEDPKKPEEPKKADEPKK